MRILALADMHSHSIRSFEGWRKMYEPDLILLLGDVMSVYIHMLRDEFADSVPYYAVLGNHDDPHMPDHWAGRVEFVGQKIQQYKENTFVGIDGCLDPIGRPSMISQPDWAVTSFLNCLPKDVENLVIVSHNSPYGIHDDPTVMSHTGFSGLTKLLTESSGTIVLHGHMHKNTTSLFGSNSVVGLYGVNIIEIENNEVTQNQSLM